MSLALFAAALLLTTVTAATMFAVATESAPGLRPATVDPFAFPGSLDPAADTLSCGGDMAKTVPAPATDWQSVTLNNLSRVQDLLDSLEAHGVAEREVVTLSDAAFTVRWR